jgi:hypothetical protein
LPFAFNPNRRYPRTLDPGSGYPHVIRSSPTPITASPDIPWSGRSGLRFNLNGRRRFCHDHFSTDHPVTPRSDDFLPDLRRRRGDNWLSLTAGEQQRRKPDKIESSFHIVSPFDNSFADGELAPATKIAWPNRMTERRFRRDELRSDPSSRFVLIIGTPPQTTVIDERSQCDCGHKS